jgi:putative transposase
MGEDYLLCQRVAASMSRVGNPYDNSVLSEVEGAKAEPFMRTLKEEEVDGRAFSNETEARDSIGLLIETVYNRHRLH